MSSKKRLKILMLNYEFPPLGGGAGNANFYLLNELAKKELDIDLVTSSKSGYEEEKFSKNIKIFKLDVKKRDLHYWTALEASTYTFKAYKLARELMKTKTYGMVHTFFALPTGIISYKLKMPKIISLRGTDVPGFNHRFASVRQVQGIAFSKICENANLVVANSEGLKQLAENSFKGNIEVIPNGIDTKEFSPSKKKKKQIICVARLIERKGINYLIEAMPRINADYKLLIIGEGPEKEKLLGLAKSNGSIERIAFLDYVAHDRLPRYYGEAEMLVLPSLYEGMSNTVLEAMSCGLPIITTNTGGSKELIDRNGMIIEKRSSTMIADAVNTLIENRKLWLEMSKISRDIALKHSWKSTAESYLKLYEKIANN